MISQIQVLIGDDSVEFGVNCASKLRKLGMYTITRPKNGDVLFNVILQNNPDIAVIDAVLPNMDAIDIIKKVHEHKEIKTMFIVTSAYDNMFIEKQVMESGASYYMLKPININSLADRINALVSGLYIDMYADEDNFESDVTEILRNMGTPAHVKGYHYIREAIVLALENRKLLESITKQLYPEVARKFETTSARVERSVRHAIEITYERGNLEYINAYFGTLCSAKEKPTNSEFIALITDKIRYQRQNNSRIKKI